MQSRRASCAHKATTRLKLRWIGLWSLWRNGRTQRKSAAVDLNPPGRPEAKARKAHCFDSAGTDFRAIRRQKSAQRCRSLGAQALTAFDENCLDHRTVNSRDLPEAFQHFFCARNGNLTQQMRRRSRLKVIIFQSSSTTPGFVGVLAGFQAEPIGDLRQNLIRDVVERA